jgi:hypothetical protein
MRDLVMLHCGMNGREGGGMGRNGEEWGGMGRNGERRRGDLKYSSWISYHRLHQTEGSRDQHHSFSDELTRVPSKSLHMVPYD